MRRDLRTSMNGRGRQKWLPEAITARPGREPKCETTPDGPFSKRKTPKPDPSKVGELCGLACGFVHYNSRHVHGVLRSKPSMAAGLADRP